ncbi:hypothetical protein [Rhizobium sp. MHM7A]|uniref:hypothetical protein n=1 Tax=Rhizobium sp. MHM7A TaxID=2583233 RepID=UPI0011062A83|nr:hypothetical protein [Rhizobium sp. MHM7A]TLX16778.1 hypothetical protein FFR93_05390 [Rhizobium sp. MHM7A]
MEFETPTEEALELWQQLIGIRAEESAKTIGAWRLYDTLKALQEAFEIDTSEITATLLLRHFLNVFIADREYTLKTLIETPGEVEKDVARTRRLIELLNRPEVAEQTEMLMQAVRNGLKHYGADEREDVAKLIDKVETLGILRRDALRSMQKLKVDQFFDGQPAEEGTKPLYHPMVHQWWNINSMLEAAFHMPSGVSLNLIRDHNDYHSFFCFLIKNGHNIFVLSDAPQWTHPLQPSQSRRPDREMDERISKHWFPYGIMNIKTDEDGRLAFAESDSTALVLHQEEALPVKPISELAPGELVWTLMMFDLIIDRFWKKGFKAPALSYTGEMVLVQDKLELAAYKAGLPTIGYQPINVAPVTVQEAADATEADGIGKQCSNRNKWLEERYRHRISEASLNAIASPDKLVFIEHNGEVNERKKTEVAALDYFKKEEFKSRTNVIQSLDATTFGSRENLLANRMYIARANYVEQIAILAQQEYEERKKDVLKWYTTAVQRNREAILKMAGCGLIWLDETNAKSRSYTNRTGPQVRLGMTKFADIEGLPRTMRSLTRLVPAKAKRSSDHSLLDTVNVEKYGEYTGRECVITHTKPSYGVILSPVNAFEVALLAGVKVSQLPDVLQHYDLAEAPSGNHLLDRIDPMDWALKNPWQRLNLQVGVPLSKRGLSRIMTKAELPAQLEELVVKNVPEEIARDEWNPELIDRRAMGL